MSSPECAADCPTTHKLPREKHMLHHAKELWDWLQALDPQFAFLLALFFAVALTAEIGDWVRHWLNAKGGGRTH